MNKTRNKILLALLFCMILGIAITANTLLRLYSVISLFDENRIIENFRSMEHLFPTKHVAKPMRSLVFAEQARPIAETYTYKGQTRRVDEFLKNHQTTGLLVIKDDQIAYENYFLGNQKQSKVISWSLSKSFISTLFGIAIDDGYINDLKAPVGFYVPWLQDSGYASVPVEDVLEMSSGVMFDENYGDFNSDINRLGRVLSLGGSLDSFLKTLKKKGPSGRVFHYISPNTQVLAAIIRETSQKDLTSYFQEKIWDKMGAESDAYWLVDGRQNELAFGGFNAILRDLAKLGLLYLHNGKLKSQQIVSEDWVKRSTHPGKPYLQGHKEPTLNSWGYGYQWWIPFDSDGDFVAIGFYNQFIYVSPRYRVVIAKSSGYFAYHKDGEELELEHMALFRAIAKDLGN